MAGDTSTDLRERMGLEGGRPYKEVDAGQRAIRALGSMSGKKQRRDSNGNVIAGAEADSMMPAPESIVSDGGVIGPPQPIIAPTTTFSSPRSTPSLTVNVGGSTFLKVRDIIKRGGAQI